MSNLTHDLLQNDPDEYLSRIKSIVEYIKSPDITPQESDDVTDVRDALNDISVYETWFSNQVQCLSYLVGRPTDVPIPREKWHNYGSYYGKGKEISEALGLEILECMAFFKPDMTIKNFYDQNIIESMGNTETCTYRKDNENFLKRVKELYIAPNSCRSISYFADIYNFDGASPS